jgi:hypothetical protein
MVIGGRFQEHWGPSQSKAKIAILRLHSREDGETRLDDRGHCPLGARKFTVIAEVQRPSGEGQETESLAWENNIRISGELRRRLLPLNLTSDCASRKCDSPARTSWLGLWRRNAGGPSLILVAGEYQNSHGCTGKTTAARGSRLARQPAETS